MPPPLSAPIPTHPQPPPHPTTPPLLSSCPPTRLALFMRTGDQVVDFSAGANHFVPMVVQRCLEDGIVVGWGWSEVGVAWGW